VGVALLAINDAARTGTLGMQIPETMGGRLLLRLWDAACRRKEIYMNHAESDDLLLLLDAYTIKHNSAVVVTNSFVQTVIMTIQQKKTGVAGIGSFLNDTKNKIYKSLEELIKAGVVFMEERSIEKICYPPFYSKKIFNAYDHIDVTIETPFPSDENLPMYNLEKYHVRHVDVLNNFTEYMSKLDKDNKTEIVRLAFVEGYGSIMTVSGLLPQRMLQISMFKLRDYLQSHNSSDFFLKKLKNYFSGKETLVLDYFKNITTMPEKSVATIMSGNNFSTSFWSCLYGLVKAELQYREITDGRRTQRDIALYQACTIILAYNNYYTMIALNERDKNLVFSVIDEEMGKPPYYYTFEEIKNFKTSQGQPILHSSYSAQELAAYIKKNLKPGDDNTMPPILIFHGPNEETWYVQKSKAVSLCARLIAEATPILKANIEERWQKMMKNYYIENTMRNDLVFDELIHHLLSENMPHLIPVLWEPKLDFVLEELKEKNGHAPLELFSHGDPLPLHKTFGLEREAIIASILANLPFRYSLKIFVNIIGFLKHGTNRELIFTRKVKRNKTAKTSQGDGRNANNIDSLVKSLLPGEKTLDGELDALEEKWNQMLNRPVREKLRKNVDEIISANFAFVLKTLKYGTLTVSILEDIAGSLITSNAVMKNIQNKKALRSYAALFMLKLMKTKETPVLQQS
jgi:hypothetical protein